MQTDWAEKNLEVIRTLMERAAVYRRAMSPVMMVVGATGITAGVFGAVFDFETSRPFAVYWGSVAVVCLAEAFFMIRRQAIREMEPFWSPPTRRVVQAIAPAFVSGLVVGIVFFVVNLPDLGLFRFIGSHYLDKYNLNQPVSAFVELIIPIWMVLYGLAMHAAAFFMPRGFRLFGWLYVLSAFVYLAYWTFGLQSSSYDPHFPYGTANFAMGAIFGGGHLAYGLYLYFTEKRGNVA